MNCFREKIKQCCYETLLILTRVLANQLAQANQREGDRCTMTTKEDHAGWYFRPGGLHLCFRNCRATIALLRLLWTWGNSNYCLFVAVNRLHPFSCCPTAQTKSTRSHIHHLAARKWHKIVMTVVEIDDTRNGSAPTHTFPKNSSVRYFYANISSSLACTCSSWLNFFVIIHNLGTKVCLFWTKMTNSCIRRHMQIG